MTNSTFPPSKSALQLTADERALFFSEEGRVSLPAGTVIMREGEPGNEMFVILEGELAISRRGIRLDYLGPGMILGEMAMIDDQPRSATATTATTCSLIRLDRAGFRELIGRSPEFALRVMNIMSVRTRRLIEEEARRQRMDEELAIGRRIQLTWRVMNSPPATAPRVRLAAIYMISSSSPTTPPSSTSSWPM